MSPAAPYTPSPSVLRWFFGRWLRPPQGLTYFPWVSISLDAPSVHVSKLCAFLIHPSFITGGVSRELRRVEGKLFVLFHKVERRHLLPCLCSSHGAEVSLDQSLCLGPREPLLAEGRGFLWNVISGLGTYLRFLEDLVPHLLGCLGAGAPEVNLHSFC